MTSKHQVAEANGQYLAEAAGQVVPAGYKQTEVGVIPEDWDCYEIGDFNPFVTSGSRGWASFYASHGDVFVRITNMSRESIYLDMTETKFVLLPYQSSEGKRTSLENGDILVSITADIGICSYVDERLEKPAFINQHVALIRFDKEEIHSKFVAYFLSSENVQKLFKGAADHGAKAGMNLDAVRKIRAAIPSKSEQTAIANALSDVDALINELEKLIAKKQAIKTATLQQLLTGRTRLPPFALREDGTLRGYKQSELGDIPEDWDIKVLSEIANVKGGKRLPKGSSLVKTPTSHPYIRVADMFVGGVDISDLCYVPNEIATTIKNYRIFEGELFISVAGSLGIVGQIGKDLDGANLTENADRICSINADSSFILYSLSSKRIQGEIAAQSTVGAQPKLALGRIESFLILLPESIQEQTAIATILSDMDTDIQTLQQRLSKTRQIKQGMMQELLTGKIRLLKPAVQETQNAEN